MNTREFPSKRPDKQKHQGHNLNSDKVCTEIENAKLIKVDIEVEEIHEYTSEEDEEDTKSVGLSRTESKESLRPMMTMRQQKNKHFYKNFEAQMQMKLELHVRTKLNDHILRKMADVNKKRQSPKYGEDTPIMHLLRSSQENSKIN